MLCSYISRRNGGGGGGGGPINLLHSTRGHRSSQNPRSRTAAAEKPPAMPPPYPSSSCWSSSSGMPSRPGDFFSGKKKPCLPAVTSAPPTKKIARPESTPNLTALHAAKKRPSSSTARPPSQPSSAAARPTPPPHQPPTPNKQTAAALPPQKKAAAGGNNKKPPPKSSSGSFMAPLDAKTVHPARRLAPGTAVCVRTRFTMITDRCCLVLWLPARVVSSSDAYHCTVKYSADLSPAFAGKMVRKPVDHVRVVAHQRASAKAQPRNVAPAPERKDRFS